MTLPEFSLTFLYKQILNEISSAEQWTWPEVAQHRADHYTRADALMCLLEHLTVFSTGLGADLNCSKLKDRVKSYRYLLNET